MKIKISYPNDYGSEADYAKAVEDCCDGDAKSEGCEEALFEKMADSAKEAGLAFLSEADYGAIWEGTKSQCAKAEELLPDWASIGKFE